MNNSPTIVKSFKGMLSYPCITSRENVFQLSKGNAKILEMEDMLFHHNSAIMMPDNPANTKEGAPASDQQKKVSGIRALALVFRQCMSDAKKKILIAGHADRSGEPAVNFDIAALRSKNVLYLLQGKRSEWAEICEQKHKIEDYQQILLYIATSSGWNCNPGAVNDTWNKTTEQALTNFVTLYDAVFSYKPDNAILGDAIVNRVKDSAGHKMPKELWEGIFDIFNHDLICATTGKHLADDTFSALRKALPFVNAEKPFVACGESFPISSDKRENYRSQTDRRVEILFFDEDELPVLICPDRKNTIHTKEECPVYNPYFYNFEYISPETFFAATYHLKFIYFDKISNDYLPVPSGLSLKAWKNDTVELETTSSFDISSGVYELTVKGITNTPREQNIHFSFLSGGQWIFVKDASTAPQIVMKMSDTDPGKTDEIITRAHVNVLPEEEQNSFYELPSKWDSRNWKCSIGGSSDGCSKQLLNMTSMTDPVIFNLEAIVLIDKNGNQIIKDSEYNIATKKEKMVSLGTDSRIALLYLDGNDENRLKIHKEHPDAKHYSEIIFASNFIDDTPKAISRLVYFNNSFYDITWKRTEPSEAEITDVNKKFICGARSAVLDDADVHVKKPVCVNLSTGASPNDYAQTWCGNYELHYLDSCGMLDGQQLSYLLIFWNCRFTPAATNPAPGAIPDWIRDGMITSMNFSNRPYIIRKKDGACNKLIRPFHYYEAKMNNRSGKHKCTVGVTTDDQDWMLPEEALFCEQSFTFRPAYYGPDTVSDVDGTMAQPLMSAHEMGHATGHFDDYLYNLEDGGFTYSGVPSFSQPYTAPGGPYDLDTAARMKVCRLPRMRDLWHFVNWLNDDTSAGKPLNPFLNGSKFKMTYTFTDPSTAASRTIETDLTDPKYRDTCKPSYKEDSFNGFGNGSVSLYLYLLGGGETAETMISGHLLNGICVVNIRIAIHFVGMNTNNDRDLWIKDHLLSPLNTLNSTYYFLANAANTFKKTLLTITPYFAISDGITTPAETHFSVIVDDATPTDIVTAGTVIKVKRGVDGQKIIRYFFGLPINSTDALVKNDFSTVATWIGSNTVANDVFTVEEF